MLDRRMLVAVPASLFLSTACVAAPDDGGYEGDVREVSSTIVDNGVAMNGVSMNGVSMNGVSMNGVSMNGVSMNGVSMNGTLFKGTLANGTQVNGTGFVGANMIATTTSNKQVILAIDDIVQSTDPEIYLYNVAYYTGTTWEALCGYDAQGEVRPAIPLAGRWDYTSGTDSGGDWIDDATHFTFACVGAALGKCTQLGYKPWKSVQECSGSTCQTHSLRSLHQACTRLVRADYCGDGTSHTEDGVSINLWDNSAIQTESTVPVTWRNDAEWSPDGAVCIGNYRYDPNGATSAYVNANCPNRKTASFGCFSSASTFFTANGYATPISSRSLVRNQFDPTTVH
ncbi:ADYC domain-containing protein [Polyangium aurulentum]|uniref:ADYC domain-containing protein n=1 Tax=Polyangium aurulentum TaxID=2567896 RepID=UPI00146A704A|nr:ADYC domain-containing protein [Polyangium aurulentum]UQA59568.1 hypothetical protein E8A73_003390 [Polyangium aurulentum]